MAATDNGPGIVGVFQYMDQLTAAIRELKAARVDGIEVFSPVASHEIQEALGQRTSPLGYATLIGALTGLVFGVSLAAYAAMKFGLITQGKPLWAWIPWFVVGFECTILFGCLANFLSMLILSGLPRLKGSPGYDTRFSVDAFGIFIPCKGSGAEKVRALLEQQGAAEVHERA
ncbi:MAG: DUF3341 domain-containing protein [bacterium]